MDMRDLLGWASSITLLATIAAQVAKQWKERSGKGVSLWLFIGETAASAGFTVYSALLGNWVFTLTNALLFISGVVGWALTAHFKRAAARGNVRERLSPTSPLKSTPASYHDAQTKET